MKATHIFVLTALCTVALMGCRTTRSDAELGVGDNAPQDVDLWVDLQCPKGQNQFGEYGVLMMPEEKVQWTLAVLDGTCRIYGAIVPKDQQTVDKCDIRLRSKEPIVKSGRCRCAAGRWDLEEGRPTSKECCQRYPDRVYCKEPVDSPEAPDATDE